MRRTVLFCGALGLLTTGCVEGGGSGIPLPPGTGSQGVRIASILSKELACKNFVSTWQRGQYSDTDIFECELTKSLKNASANNIVVEIPQTISANLPKSQEEQNKLTSELPDRLAGWTYAVEQSGGQVAVCIENRSEFWGTLIGLGLAALEQFLGNRAEHKKVQERYDVASNYHAAVIFDAKGSDATASLKEVAFQKRSAGKIVNPNCTFRSE